MIVKIKNDKLVIDRSKKQHPTIEELFANYMGPYQPKEIDWGKEEGKEIILANYDRMW